MMNNNRRGFIAPDAKVLIVDDNEMNCDFMLALFEPLQIKADVVYNGKKAVEMISYNVYHIVFMDHMMPVMDGVEAVGIIRNKEGIYYKELPIIALTGNDSDNAYEFFINAGMTDFMAKPVDTDRLYNMLLTYLPEGVVEVLEECNHDKMHCQEGIHLEIKGINVSEGIKNLGSIELLYKMLGDFYRLIDSKALKIENLLADSMIKDYTIEVHALKNTARMIGAMELSGMFETLEKLGNTGDIEELRVKTPEVLESYCRYKEYLKAYALTDDNKRKADSKELIMYLQGIKDAISNFDIDTADEAMKCLEECILPENCNELMESLRVCVADVAMEDIIKLTEQMIEMVEE